MIIFLIVMVWLIFGEVLVVFWILLILMIDVVLIV